MRLSPSTSALIAIAFLTVLSVGVTMELGWIPLRRIAASRGALLFAALAVAAVPVIAAAMAYLGQSMEVLVIAIVLPPVAAAVLARIITPPAGSPWPIASEDDRVLAGAHAASQLLEVGDVDGAADQLRAVRGSATERTRGYMDLWLTLVREEQLRRDGVRISSEKTRAAIYAEFSRIRSQQGRPPRTAMAALTLASVAVSLTVPVTLGLYPAGIHACLDAQRLLADAEAHPRLTPVGDAALAYLTLVSPGQFALPIADEALDLDAAGASRHDPLAREKLEAAGFVAAHHRVWLTEEGRRIGAEVFVFDSPAGAAQFHRQMTEHACTYANDAFAGPDSETGLQIRYRSGDPIVEQLAWVDGGFRVVVSRSYVETPPNHDDIIALARLAAESLASPIDPGPSPLPTSTSSPSPSPSASPRSASAPPSEAGS